MLRVVRFLWRELARQRAVRASRVVRELVDGGRRLSWQQPIDVGVSSFVVYLCVVFAVLVGYVGDVAGKGRFN